MDAKLTTNPYKQDPAKFAAVYVRQLFIQFWFILIPVTCFILWNVIYALYNEPSVFGLIPVIVLLVVFFFARYRLLNKLKKSPALKRSRILNLYEHCIELVEETGVITTFFFADISNVTSSGNLYHFRLRTKQTFWVPKNAFKTIGEREAFEDFLCKKGKMK